MIVRVLTEGQFEVPEQAVDDLNRLDEALSQAVERNDEEGFPRALEDLVDAITSTGSRLADEDLRPSDAIVPPPDASLGEVIDLLGEEGLLPG